MVVIVSRQIFLIRILFIFVRQTIVFRIVFLGRVAYGHRTRLSNFRITSHHHTPVIITLFEVAEVEKRRSPPAVIEAIGAAGEICDIGIRYQAVGKLCRR